MNEDMEKMLQEAPAPTLTLEPFAEEKEEPAVVEKEEVVQPVDEKEKIKAILTPQEQKQVVPQSVHISVRISGTEPTDEYCLLHSR